MEFLDSSLVTSVHIKEHTRRDPILSKAMHFCEVGWSTSVSDAGLTLLTLYIQRKEELSLQVGRIM